MGTFREGSKEAGCTDVSNTQGGIKEGTELRYSANELNLLTLPSLPLSDRKVLPKKISAIYFALSESNEVLYIGRAVCLHTRWNGQKHHKQVNLQELKNVRIAWLKVNERALLPKIEHALIEYFDPPLNLVNNAFASPMGGERSLPAEQKKSAWVRLRVTNQELAMLKAEADKREITISEVIRDLINRNLSKSFERERQAS